MNTSTNFYSKADTVPPGTDGRTAPRPRLSVKNYMYIDAGVIDKDYSGQVQILFINHSDTEFLVQ